MNSLKLRYVLLILAVLCALLALSACDNTHTHTAGEWITDAEATCIENGLRYKACTDCGETLETETLPALGHSAESIKGYAATCTADGLTDGVKCSVCETVLTEQTAIPAPGHSEQTVKGYAATCTADGLTDGVKCSVCETILTEQTAIPAPGHSAETVKGYAATCTTDGLTDGAKCSVCETVLTEQTAIPALGHSDGDNNCICDSCKIELDHKNENGDCTCDRCGAVVGEHSDKNGDFYCDNCGDDVVISGGDDGGSIGGGITLPAVPLG